VIFKCMLAGWSYKKSDIQDMQDIGFVFEESKINPEWVDIHYRAHVQVEINSMDDMMKFAKTHGKIVFDGEMILIYNDYIE
jgi:hypothetical protein